VEGRFRFTKKERITSSREFKWVIRNGKRLSTKNYIIFMKENEKGFHRLGIIIKKEVGRAALRNRVKRCLREFFRLNKHRIGGSFDIIILVKKGIFPKKYWEVEEELLKALG
jgi:ribonuclease P protein component